MAGVAQDEIRKLSERLKSGFHQAIKNGRVLGNDRLYGYDKRDCVLTVNEAEAEIVRTVFDLYANHGLGARKISQRLSEMGYTSREGNAFNQLTIRHILENPKYKGWYCASSNPKFKSRNDARNARIENLEVRHRTQERQKASAPAEGKIRQILERELSFLAGIHSALFALRPGKGTGRGA